MAVCLPIVDCSYLLQPPQTRGNKVEEEQLKQLIPGTSTKADVTTLIGSPTQKATFDDNTWLYITEVPRPRLGQTLGVLDQNVLVVTFDDRGVLSALKPVSKNDSVAVDVAARTTPSPGTDASFMQQLLGNIGKFTPTGAGGFGGGGGAPSSGGGI